MFDPATLTIADLDRVEAAVGRGLADVASFTAADFLVVLRTLGVSDPKSFTVDEVRRFFEAPDTLPTSYEDGLPTDGRVGDRWVVMCAFRFGWPPSVTRQQTLRDLRLLVDSQGD